MKISHEFSFLFLCQLGFLFLPPFFHSITVSQAFPMHAAKRKGGKENTPSLCFPIEREKEGDRKRSSFEESSLVGQVVFTFPLLLRSHGIAFRERKSFGFGREMGPAHAQLKKKEIDTKHLFSLKKWTLNTYFPVENIASGNS